MSKDAQECDSIVDYPVSVSCGCNRSFGRQNHPVIKIIPDLLLPYEPLDAAMSHSHHFV